MNNLETQKLMGTIKDTVAQIFETVVTEEEIYQLEQAIHQEVKYVACIAQSERVAPGQGWDCLGR